TLARLGQLSRTPRERRADPVPLRQIAEAYADLAERHDVASPRRIELLAISAAMWSLAGYQANSVTLAAAFQRDLQTYFSRGEGQVVETVTTAAPYRIAAVTGAVLHRDIDDVARLGAQAQAELRQLGAQLADAAADGRADQADLAVLAAYGLVGRAARQLSMPRSAGTRSRPRCAHAC
uniref:hypothetical protein n=1 Tax=Streptomyces sp. RPT161 TaxID=3015993 RepID=UPI0022B93E3B